MRVLTFLFVLFFAVSAVAQTRPAEPLLPPGSVLVPKKNAPGYNVMYDDRQIGEFRPHGDGVHHVFYKDGKMVGITRLTPKFSPKN